MLYSDGERMAAKINAAGGACTLKSYKGMLHGFLRLTEAVGAARTAVADAGAWLRGVMK